MNILANATGATTKLPTGTKSLATGKSSGMDTSGDVRTIPYIAPPIITISIKEAEANKNSAVGIKTLAFLRRYKTKIEQIIAKDLVQDAIDRALSYSNLAESRTDYIGYFQAIPYEYLKRKLSANNDKLDDKGMLTWLLETEKPKEIVFRSIVTDAYKNKIEDVYNAVIKYKGLPPTDPRDYKATSEQVEQGNQDQRTQDYQNSKKGDSGGDELQEGSKKSNVTIIILAVAVLAVIFILKKKKRG